MAATLQTLKTWYGNVMRSDYAHIPAAHQTLLTDLSAQVQAGTLTLSAAQSQVIGLAAGTTSVASLTYSFFTGGLPSEGGFDFLVAAGGPNANSLNSAYYQSFNTENRYINFAVNLGKVGEGQARFSADYGALSLTDTLVKAYTAIFGSTPDAAKIDAILNAKVSNGAGVDYTRADYFASYGGDGLNGLGTKAALIGWLMAEAVKADVGVYAKANDAFLADLADDGVAAFRSGLLSAYGDPPAATPGATLTVAGDKSISPTATDPTLKSTAGDDTITGTVGLGGAYTLDAGAGRDTISLTGTIYGQVQTSDGHDTITLGDLGVTTATLGVPSVAGSVKLIGGGDTVTLKGGMAQGTSVTAAGTANVLHIDNGGAALEGTISGFQTVYLHSGGIPAGLTGASVIYSLAGGSISIDASQTLILKDTANATVIYAPADPQNGARIGLHLQHFQGAPTTDAVVAPGIFVPNGGAIGLYTIADGPQDNNGTFLLHVDTDSTAGLIYGWSTNRALGVNYRGPLPNLTIDGAGSLTAQIAGSFTNVDATQAGDLTLSYDFQAGSQAQTVRLGDGTNSLTATFAGVIQGSLSIADAKLYLGAGADTIRLGSNASLPTLSNLHIKDGTTLSGPPQIIGFQKGVDHLILDAQAHAMTAGVQTYADGKTSLQDALIAVSAHVAVNTAAVFTWGGDTYVYTQDGTVGVNMGASANTGDGLIRLVGVTGLTVGTGAGDYDIHYG